MDVRKMKAVKLRVWCRRFTSGRNMDWDKKNVSWRIFLEIGRRWCVDWESKSSKSGIEGVLRKSTFSHFSSWENDFPVVKSGFWGNNSHYFRGMFVLSPSICPTPPARCAPSTPPRRAGSPRSRAGCSWPPRWPASCWWLWTRTPQSGVAAWRLRPWEEIYFGG